MGELRKSIREEEWRIADSYANEYQIAKTRESELSVPWPNSWGRQGQAIRPRPRCANSKVPQIPSAIYTTASDMVRRYHDFTVLLGGSPRHAATAVLWKVADKSPGHAGFHALQLFAPQLVLAPYVAVRRPANAGEVAPFL